LGTLLSIIVGSGEYFIDFDYIAPLRFRLSDYHDMSQTNECYAYFSVVGTFDPADITQRLGTKPTQSWREGEVNPRTHLERKFSRWSLHSRLEKTSALELHIADVLDQLDSNSEAFQQLSIGFDGVLQLVAYFHVDFPGLTFERDVVTRLAQYSLSLDFDFYYLYSEISDNS
jgi:hypothetical protein